MAVYVLSQDVSDEAKRPTPDDRRDITSIRTIVASGTTNLPEKNVKKNVKNVQVQCAQYTSPVTPEAISIKSQSYIKLLENDNALCNTVTGEPSMACVKKLYDLLNAVASFDVMRQYSPRVRTLLVEVNFPEESEEGESGKIIESVMKEYA
ncbi:hypothetical protein SARC_06593 [Sphaeroforma arctica JP610]|uniref:Uncharacterized protein n=1 Tax=Sphaeroforma arctica JP610 TaxID=667725 RepID=A0A0L0FW72_9EUKA|nr:hypothetical protein SARC_06593 [Sphaeroforma arctica JP610]KNC81070.1 hypothetical protein SARC_06593 [Sphaeroforma arctica JP610]|eukprot:XP_014154972.1 hypothetical protein SARC_06593 [Sphaeroforma arctica JP610]